MWNKRTGMGRCSAAFAMIAAALCVATQSHAQVQFNGGATIDFTGFAGGGFAPMPAAGQLDSDDWSETGMSDGATTFGGTFVTGDFARGTSTGGVTTGGTYAFDISGNIALGVQPGGSDWTPGTLTLRVQNVTGATLSSIDVSYVAYYLNDADRSNSFNFSYSTDDVSYTAVPALDLVSPDTLTMGATWTANPRNTTISGISVVDGGFLYVRWTGDDVGGAGSRDEFALDDIVLGAGGTPTGACYLIDSCVETTLDDCNTMGGLYDGDGTTCPPPLVFGACCEGATCTDGVTEVDCVGVGGSYRGDDTVCSTPGICDAGAGACCVAAVCQIATGPTDCCSLGGIYLGEGSMCDVGICDQIVDIATARAAAVGAPITLNNVVVTSATDTVSSSSVANFTVQDLSGPGGTDRGITIFDATSTIDAILAGAPEGSVISITGLRSAFNGLDEVGTITGWQVCSSTTVPTPISISVADLQTGNPTAEDLESVLVTLSCVEFDAGVVGGTFGALTNYTVTDPMTNQTAVMRVSTAMLDIIGQTIPSGGVAITGVVSQFDTSINADGGYQLLVRSISDIDTCGTAVGACFINGGLDCVVTTLSDCIGQSGTYQGDGTTCPAATGACCESNGTICNDGITAFDCGVVGGNYRGDGSLCSTPDICELGAGACCVDAACQIAANPAECCSLSGVYLGEGTTCTAGICDTLVTIEQAKAATNGDPIFVKNVVVTETTDLVSGTSFKSFTVQDMSGAGGADRGITVFGSNLEIDTILGQVVPGSIVSINGARSDFNGLIELGSVSNIHVCGSTSVPSPVAITTSDMQEGSLTAEALESVLVTLSCVTFDTAGVFAVGNYPVSDVITGETALVRVQTSALDLVGQPIPTGAVEVTGILSQFDNTIPQDGGYQLLPISIAGIVPCTQVYGACCGASAGGSCPTCVGDMNGDNAVNLADVEDYVAALLGQTISNPGAESCANTDLDGNGDVNGLDTQSFIGLLTSGATCGNTCSVQYESDCTTQGGTFQGSGTDCDANPCNP